jgi:hypothetical protein
MPGKPEPGGLFRGTIKHLALRYTRILWSGAGLCALGAVYTEHRFS